ncbi:MAG: hypothetical protein IJS99_10575 [Synergistaceae bacterium]|nr:hypothetical protein [Synergistaceae bacterium]
MTDKEKSKCHVIIHGAATSAGAIGAGLAQIPGSDAPLITTIQIGMIISLGAVFGKTITKTVGASILSGAAAAIGGRTVSQFLLGWIPGLGNAINAGTAFTITEAIGWYVANDFANEVEINTQTDNVESKEQAAAIAVVKEESRKLPSVYMLALMFLSAIITVTACYFIDNYINKISVHPKLWSVLSGFAIVFIINCLIFIVCRNIAPKAKATMSYSNYLAAVLNIFIALILSPEFNSNGWDEAIIKFFNMPLLNMGLIIITLFWWFKVDERILREFN